VISPIMIHYPYRENWCVRRALRLRYVGASSSRVRLATPAGPSQRITPGCPFPFPLPPSSPSSPPSLALFSPRRVSVPAPPTTDATLAVVAVHGLAAVGARPSSARQLVPSALVRPAADLPSDARGQPRRPVPTTVGSSNKCGPPAIPKSSETRCDSTIKVFRNT